MEVANLGRPGGSASDHAKIAAKAVPALKPDLVIVGLLQGDDLAQVLYSSAGPVDRLKEVVKTLFPNFLEMAHRPPPPEGVEVRGVWKAEAARLLAHYAPEQRTSFDRIDPQIRRLFAVGQINPALVDLAVSHPDYLLRPLDLEAPEVRDAIASLAGDLRRIRTVSERFGARMVVISVPLGAYTSRRKLDSHRRTGFLVADWLLTTTAMDAAAAAAAHRAGVDFHEFTRAFREVADTGRLFFELDGHFTPAGSRVFAHGAEPIVAAELDRIAEDRN